MADQRPLDPPYDPSPPHTNGRVSTRDLLDAVQGSELRLGHRIDRLEGKLEGKLDDHTTRIVILETESAIEHARSRDVIAVLGGLKTFMLSAVSVGGLIIAGIAAGVWIN